MDIASLSEKRSLSNVQQVDIMLCFPVCLLSFWVLLLIVSFVLHFLLTTFTGALFLPGVPQQTILCVYTVLFSSPTLSLLIL